MARRDGIPDGHTVARSVSSWTGASRVGLGVVALVIGLAGGLGAVGFRYLVYALTWVATGHSQFGQQGRVASSHLPWLGVSFFVLAPVIGGLLYGPLVDRWAPEARGHGVPAVMDAVAERGGKIRTRVTFVKALASALCIGWGGSVGREGPIVQIGSALGSSLGQAVRVPRTRLVVLVACGAAAGISATFNAPITGVFFGFELILRSFSVDALFAIILSAAAADLISHAFFGSQPFFADIPHDLVLTHPSDYLLVAALGIGCGLVGVGFTKLLYKVEDLTDALWHGRPEWARPAAGGIALGLLLLAMPQLYGVGYPVMDDAISGHIVLWFLVLLAVGKMFATSLTIGIGGSGGVFAPSLFVGAMVGTAFGEVARNLFGPAVGQPALYGVIAMGAVFAAATQAPLTSISSVAEMSGNFGLALPLMLAIGIATGLSKALTYGTIYTTKLLRRGIDVDHIASANLAVERADVEPSSPLQSATGSLGETKA